MRGGRGASRLASRPVETRPPPVQNAVTIVIGDDSSSDSSHGIGGSGYESDSSMSGDSNVYYGGYGRCFNCGELTVIYNILNTHRLPAMHFFSKLYYLYCAISEKLGVVLL